MAAGYMVASPDGATLYMLAGGTVIAVSTQTFSISRSSTRLGLVSLSITPDGKYIYGSSYAGVSILSTPSLKVVGSITTLTPQPPLTAIFVD